MSQTDQLIQEIFTIIKNRGLKFEYDFNEFEYPCAKIVINLIELKKTPSIELIKKAAYRLYTLDSTWLLFNDGRESKHFHLNFINSLVYSDTNLSFDISYYYLLKLKACDFNFDNFKKFLDK